MTKGYSGRGKGFNSGISNVDTVTVLDAQDFSVQAVSGAGMSFAIPIAFGPNSVSSDGMISHAAGGLFEVLQPLKHSYIARITGRIKSDNPGLSARILAWLLVKYPGTGIFIQPPNSPTFEVQLRDNQAQIRETATVVLSKELPQGTQFKFMYARDETEANQGSFVPYTPGGTFAGLNPVPSARMLLTKVYPV